MKKEYLLKGVPRTDTLLLFVGCDGARLLQSLCLKAFSLLAILGFAAAIADFIGALTVLEKVDQVFCGGFGNVFQCFFG